MLTYKLDYLAAGRRPATSIYSSQYPLEPGHRITVSGVHLVVERVIRPKRDDTYAGIAMCKLPSA
jgi:hypothetical protein